MNLRAFLFVSLAFSSIGFAAPIKVQQKAFDRDWKTDKEIKPGTCYVASSVAAIHRLSPQALKNVFTWNADGSLKVDERGGKMNTTVRLYAKAPKTGEYHPVEVKVDLKPIWKGADHDKILPRDLTKYTSDVLALEAFKQFRLQRSSGGAGWARVASGGMANRVMSAFLGGASTLTNFSATKASADKLYKQINDATADSRPVVAGTSNPGAYITPRLAQGARQGIIADKKLDFVDAKVVDTHAYTVVGTTEKQELVKQADGTKQMQSVRYVRLRNPWGNRLPPGESQGFPGAKRGFVDVELGKFTVLFSQLYVGPKVAPDAVAAN